MNYLKEVSLESTKAGLDSPGQFFITFKFKDNRTIILYLQDNYSVINVMESLMSCSITIAKKFLVKE
jgi:hypothetical protein